ncbi:FAD-dependent oxidoreductase [Myxococcota bacterium]|nr:FAD-dependent oxidoreductase [Myxococcota bacterium]
MLIQNKKQKSYVVVGGGYAGRMAALRLRTRDRAARIVVVEPSSVVVERARYHEVLGGWRQWKIPMAQALPRDGEHWQGWVEAIDATNRVVTARIDGEVRRIEADGIVVALGSRARGIESIDAKIPVFGAEEPETAGVVGGSYTKDAPLVVVGTGLTGIEIATVLAQRHGAGRVVLVGSEEPGSGLSEGARAYTRAFMERVGLRFALGRVERVEGDTLFFAGDERWRAGAVLGCAGFRVSPFAKEMGWPVDAQGRALVTPTLALPNTEGIFVAGDLAACHQGNAQGPLYRSACATAMPMGCHAAEQIIRSAQGQKALPFSLGYLVQCVALGRRDGVLQFVASDDRPTPRFWTGWRAAWTKEAILRMTWQAPALERCLRVPVFRWASYQASESKAEQTPQNKAERMSESKTDGHTKPAV